MRTVGERLKMLRIGCESGDFTGWVPMTHMIWDFEDLGSVLYLGHGVSASCSTGYGDETDSISVAGNGFSALFRMSYGPLEFEECGFRSEALSLSFDEDIMGKLPELSGDFFDMNGWDARALSRLIGIVGMDFSKYRLISEVLRLSPYLEVTLNDQKHLVHLRDGERQAHVAYDDGTLSFELAGEISLHDGFIRISRHYELVDICTKGICPEPGTDENSCPDYKTLTPDMDRSIGDLLEDTNGTETRKIRRRLKNGQE